MLSFKGAHQEFHAWNTQMPTQLGLRLEHIVRYTAVVNPYIASSMLSFKERLTFGTIFVYISYMYSFYIEVECCNNIIVIGVMIVITICLQAWACVRKLEIMGRR